MVEHTAAALWYGFGNSTQKNLAQNGRGFLLNYGVGFESGGGGTPPSFFGADSTRLELSHRGMGSGAVEDVLTIVTPSDNVYRPLSNTNRAFRAISLEVYHYIRELHV